MAPRIVPPVSGGPLSILKSAGKKSRVGVVAGRIGVERARDVRRLMGRRDGPMGATHRRFDLEGSLSYIDAVFADYLTYGGLDRADLAGARVLELGPGDSLGVAIRFVAAGADRVVAADRFVPYRDLDYEHQVYAALIERLPAEERERVASITAGKETNFDDVPLEFVPETPIEAAPSVLGTEEFDLIVSRAVLEHVHDLDTAFDSMDRLLRPAGTMIHKVDLRDHGLFTDGGQNALTFLTIDDRVYRWMGEESAGLPNRRMIGWYERTLIRLGYASELLVTHLAGVEEELEPHVPLGEGLPPNARVDVLASIRPRLLERYRAMSDAELSIAGFMVVTRKPAV